MPSPRARRTLRLAAAATALVLVAGTAPASANPSGFKTGEDPMLLPLVEDVEIEALITVGDTVAGGYRFESIPDGLSLRARGNGRVDLYVNHETSTVPFPYIPTSVDPGESQNDFDNAQVSHLILNQHSAGILNGSLAIGSEEGYQRFCSNYLATEKEHFDRPILFTNEEAIDWVKRSGTAWPAAIGSSDARQAGVVVAYDVKSRTSKPIWGMGRHNHENSVAVPLPDFDGVALYSGDDTFVSNPAQSQLYTYVADSADAVWNDEGDLFAFVSDNSAVNDYYDFPIGSTMSESGTFVRVPDFTDDSARSIAHGRRADGTDVLSTDFSVANGYVTPYVAPPNDGTWQRDTQNVGIDGPQWVLEQWGDRAPGGGVFQFVRVEDIAYDKRPGMSNILYIADSGRGSTSTSGNAFASTNGRIWRMELDPADPTRVLSLRVLVEGDNDVLKRLTEIHQPDNLETTANGSLLVQEDPGSGQQFVPADSGLANATGARMWQVDLDTWNPSVADSPSKRPITVVSQAADESADDVDPADVLPIPAPAFPISPGNLGAWESSGVVDASSVFGPGAFLVTVQAHTLWVDMAPETVNAVNPPATPDWTYKREGGQLLLIRIPGA